MDSIGIIYNIENYIRKTGISIFNGLKRTFSSFNYSKQSHANKELKDIYKGKRCFILGNGPSLRSEDLSLLKNEIVFTVNGFMRASDLYNLIEPDYHFLFDPEYFKEETVDFINKDIETIENELINNYKKPIIVMPYGSSIKIDIEKYTKVIYLNNTLISNSIKKKYDITKPVERFSAVIHYAIAFATYLGIKEIYLLGVEQSNIISYLQGLLNIDMNTYAYEVSQKDIDSAKKVLSADEYKLENVLKGYARIFGDYIRLYSDCKKMGVNIYNCTEESLIEDIPHRRLKEVLNIHKKDKL